MPDVLRARLLDAVGSVCRPSLECAPQPDEYAIVDAVIAALDGDPGIASRLAWFAHQHDELPAPDELRALRVAAGLSCKQVGELVGVTGPAVSHWEAGRAEPQHGSPARIKYLQLIEQLQRQAVGGER